MTPRQYEAYSYFRAFTEEHGFPPSMGEAAKALRARSKSGVFEIVRRLTNEGFLVARSGQGPRKYWPKGMATFAGRTVTLRPEVEDALKEYCRGRVIRPETVIAEAVAEYLGLSGEGVAHVRSVAGD